mgnify:CR=1 FL=1
MIQLAFRWYGHNDPVTLNTIRQISVIKEIVFAQYDAKPGTAWDKSTLRQLVGTICDAGLMPGVIESIPVAESIKLGNKDRDAAIEAWITSMKLCAELLIPYEQYTGHKPVITYNFMPAFDWLRTNLAYTFNDGSVGLAYEQKLVDTVNPLSNDFSLPGWIVDKTETASLLAAYSEITEALLYENMLYFLKAVIPYAESCGVVLALHPDDPPWSVFGLPRIATGASLFDRLFKDVPSMANGLCFCTGSLGCTPGNDIYTMAETFVNRIQFAHLRNVKWLGEKSFVETAHVSEAGDLDMAKIVHILGAGERTFPIRPDHGRMIWGEQGKLGYGLYDRALGAMYLAGLLEMNNKQKDFR